MKLVQMWLFMTHQSEPLRQTSLLMLLAGGIGHGDALLQSLKAHESENDGHWSGKIGQLRLMMEQGYSLSSALAAIRDVLPDQTISAIRTGENTGALAEVLIDEARRISRSVQKTGSGGMSVEALILMLLAVGGVMTTLVTFLLIFIIPKYKEIFNGFGVKLPRITILMMDTADFFLRAWFLFLLPVTAVILATVWFGFSSARQRLKHGYHRFMEKWPRYWVPGLLRQLSLSAATSQPLNTALDTVMMDLPPGRGATRISELRHRVSGGQDLIEAMEQTGLIRTREAAFLQSSLKTRHLDWGLKHLAESIERKRGRLVRRMPEIVAPILILCTGCLVLFFMAAFFTPMVELIDQFSRETPK